MLKRMKFKPVDKRAKSTVSQDKGKSMPSQQMAKHHMMRNTLTLALKRRILKASIHYVNNIDIYVYVY